MSNVHNNLDELFSDTANALRSVYNISGTIVADNFPNIIREYGSGGSSGTVDIGELYERYQIEGGRIDYVSVTRFPDNLLLTIETSDNDGRIYTHKLRLLFNV